jgi:type IV secretory pathway TrbD component
MNDAAAHPSGGGRHGILHRALPVAVVIIAAVLQLAVGFFTASSGLLAPLWAILVFVAVWVVAVVVLVRVARRRPLLTPVVPVANGLFWWLAMTAGETWLGWTA